jgi:haloalkane dehalogenase
MTYFPLTDEEERAYDAPFPGRIAMAGARTFPSLRNQLVGLTESRLEVLKTYQRPFLTIFGGNDPGLAGDGDGQPWMIENIPGAAGQPHERLPNASHFLQDDLGPEIGASLVAFLEANP